METTSEAVCLPFFLPTNLSACLYVPFYPFDCLFCCLSTFLPAYRPFCLLVSTTFLSALQSFSLPTNLYAFQQPPCLPTNLSACPQTLSTHEPFCLPTNLPTPNQTFSLPTHQSFCLPTDISAYPTTDQTLQPLCLPTNLYA